MDKKDPKEFPHEFDTPVTTEREVETYQMDIDKKTNMPKLKVVKNKIQETVTYHFAPEQSFSCKKGGHKYVITDNKKYIAKCMTCSKSWRLNPQYQKLINYQIMQRDHDYLID